MSPVSPGDPSLNTSLLPGVEQALRVIIPTRNEALALPRLLQDLHAQQGVSLRIRIADGGSQDATRDVARRAGAEVVRCAAGRGQQMNTAWQGCTDSTLLFLHADSRLPDPQLLARALRNWQPLRATTAGHFRLRFADAPDPQSRFFRHLRYKSGLNKPQTYNGDQGLLIDRALLTRAGGFDTTLPFLEDQALAAALAAAGARLHTLPGELHTSARRFAVEGPGPRYFAMLLIMCAREAGCTAFLRDAPTLYREQSRAGRLDVAPLLDRLLDEARAQPEAWTQVARYLRDNAWQLPAWLDTLTGLAPDDPGAPARPGPWLALYEQRLESAVRRFDHADPWIAQILKTGFGRVLPRLLPRSATAAGPDGTRASADTSPATRPPAQTAR